MSSTDPTPQNPRSRSILARTPRRTVVVALVAVVVLGAMGTALALSFTNLNPEHISLFGGTTAASNFAVTNLTSTIPSQNVVKIAVTLTNQDTTAHSATVFVQLLDSSGNAIVNQTLPTGSVAGGAPATLHYTFTGAGFATQYDSSFLSVHDVS